MTRSLIPMIFQLVQKVFIRTHALPNVLPEKVDSRVSPYPYIKDTSAPAPRSMGDKIQQKTSIEILASERDEVNVYEKRCEDSIKECKSFRKRANVVITMLFALVGGLILISDISRESPLDTSNRSPPPVAAELEVEKSRH
ncbi:hypothetical protein LIER_23193 [Lithospermum erythrorhizon]|uniref:Transmembrane protein n=1 Tax=Lithospermum erythrorhizon TaxID=34254 RepID=A0AAV3QZZ7_LITER